MSLKKLSKYKRYVDENSKREIKEQLMQYDRSLLVADPRRMETKKCGGKGARSKMQKAYRWLKIKNYN